MTVLTWWRTGPARLRLRRRLLVFSAPVALLLVVVIVKSLSVVIAGDSAASAYTERDNAGLRRAVDSLTVLNVIEPAKAYFAAGSLAVLDNRLEEADRQFSESLARTELPNPARPGSTSSLSARHWVTARPRCSMGAPPSPNTSAREPLSNKLRRVASLETPTRIRSGRCSATTRCAASTRRSTPRRSHRLHLRPRRAPRLHHRHRRNQEGPRLKRTRNCASNPAHRWINCSRYFATPQPAAEF